MSQKTNKPVIAAFDFDGTITKRDTLLPFLFFAAGKRATIRKLFKLMPYFIGYIFHRVTRQEIKEMVLQRFFGGMPIGQLREIGEAFAHSEALKRLVIPNAIKRLDWHRRQKHCCILVSASLDIYLDPWHQRAGFTNVICSELEIDKHGIVTGKLRGLNCWGPEKERRVEELLGPRENYILYAYGDSRGDKEMLEAADYPFYRKMPTVI